MSHPSRADGFTLIEVLTTIAISGLLMAIAIGGWASWSKASAESGASRDLLVVLRQAQQRAITDGKATCVSFVTGATSSYTVASGPCGATTGQLRRGTLASNLQLASPSFTKTGSPDVPGQTSVQFNPRGSGWPGTVKVTRTGSTKSYTLRVEVLTGHVALEQS